MKTRGKQTPSAWEGDWEKRVYQRIEELGYSNYLDYLQARRGHSYEELAEELSSGRNEFPIAPFSSKGCIRKPLGLMKDKMRYWIRSLGFFAAS